LISERISNSGLNIAKGMKGAYSSGEYGNNYNHQSWHDTLDKAVKGRQEKGKPFGPYGVY
jgi:hypothetical protein